MGEAQRSESQRVGDWVVEQKIGSGSFSVVWKARNIHTGQLAAVKEVATDKLNDKLKESLASELAILKRTKHENIVDLYDILKTEDRIFLILEYCAGGDLSGHIKRCGRVSESFAQHCLKQLAAGLEELRKHNLVHRDLKPQNLLLMDRTEKATLKIADFGFARSLQPQGLAETLCGSPLYMAPEILKFHRYDAKADLWSVGAILYELVVGRPPFDGNNHLHLLQNIERKEVRIPDRFAQHLSLECKILIHRLLKRNPIERITFEEFFSDPFICGRLGALVAGPPEMVNGCRSVFECGGGLGQLSVVKEETLLQTMVRRESSGEASSANTEVRDAVVGYGGFIQSNLLGEDGVTDQKMDTSLSDSFDKDYVLVECPSSTFGCRTCSSSLALTDAMAASKQSLPPNPSVPQPDFLYRAALLMNELADGKKEGGCPQDAFAVLMLSVQVLDRVLQLSAAPNSCSLDSSELQSAMGQAVSDSQKLSEAIEPAALSQLPNVYEMVFQHALSYSRGAAVDELMGNYARSQELYRKALDLLWFLSEEAPKLSLEPQIRLSGEEADRIQQYMTTINTRRSACSSTVGHV